MNAIINEITSRLESQLLNSQCYDDVYRKFKHNFAFGEVLILFSDLNEDQVVEWVSPEMEKWRIERAPMSLYAKIMILVLLNISIPSVYLSHVCKMLNYYGNYDVVISILQNKDLSCSSNFYRLQKHLVKALKRLGSYRDALCECRKAINHAIAESNEIEIFFFLMLYAKLCDDYHPKKGMHIFYHEKAFLRIQRVTISKLSSEKRRHAKRTPEICMDSYAKVLCETNQDAGIKLYKNMFKLHQKKDDTRIRLEANYYISQLQMLINTFTFQNYGKITRYLSMFEEITDQSLHIYGNEIAYAVRICQYVTLCRKLLITI